MVLAAANGLDIHGADSSDGIVHKHTSSGVSVVNVNIYLQDELLEHIDRLAQELGQSRSALIRQAVEVWIARRPAGAWPAELRNWRGEENFPPFELGRRDESRRPEDPFESPPGAGA